MRGTVERPEGLVYAPDALAADDEAAILAELATWRFDPIELHGQVAKRSGRDFGIHYDVSGRSVAPGEPMPAFVLTLRARAAAIADAEPGRFVEALVLRYPPGAGIGWHRDAPHFGSPVVGLSLGAPCALRFQRTLAGTRRVFELGLAPRSAYVLAGAARWQWQHHIGATPDLRYSVTFRSLRSKP